MKFIELQNNFKNFQVVAVFSDADTEFKIPIIRKTLEDDCIQLNFDKKSIIKQHEIIDAVMPALKDIFNKTTKRIKYNNEFVTIYFK